MDKITPLRKSSCHHIWLIVVDYVIILFRITANLTKMGDWLRFVVFISPVWDGTKMGEYTGGSRAEGSVNLV